jgi:hypothetical protein
MCDKKGEVLQKCEEFIRTFNPVTHSIDSHIETQLAKKSKVSVTTSLLHFHCEMTHVKLCDLDCVGNDFYYLFY